MKKFLYLILAMTVVLASAVSMASCNKGADETTSSNANTSENSIPAPEGYKGYANDEMTLFYPDSWSLSEESSITVISDKNNTQNNIAISKEEKNAKYNDMTKESFDTLFGTSLKDVGCKTSDEKFGTLTNSSGINFVTVEYTVSPKSSAEFKQKVFIFHSENHTFSITFTEVAEDTDTLNKIIESITIKG